MLRQDRIIIAGVIDVVRTSANISVEFGEDITLSCEAKGYPPPFVTWLHDLGPIYQNPRITLSSYHGYGELHIADAEISDAGLYYCVVVSNLHGSTVVRPAISVTVKNGKLNMNSKSWCSVSFTHVANQTLCEDHLKQTFVEGSYFYTITGRISQAAADIVFVVDESGSMAYEHEWIRKSAVSFDKALKDQGVGVGKRQNMYALVGFGRNDPSAILGVTLAPLTSLDGFLNVTDQLALNGLVEDGYAAIYHVLQTIESRPDTAKQIILVSDEDREALRKDLSFESLSEQLKNTGYVLNAVVNQGFMANQSSSVFALGLRGDGKSFIFNQSSSTLFSTSSGGFPSSAEVFNFGSTFEDYVQLSFSTGGVAWDLNQLREGGNYSIAFTNAFTQAKLDEIMAMFNVCFLCQCTRQPNMCVLQSDFELENCVGEYTGIDYDDCVCICIDLYFSLQHLMWLLVQILF